MTPAVRAGLSVSSIHDRFFNPSLRREIALLAALVSIGAGLTLDLPLPIAVLLLALVLSIAIVSPGAATGAVAASIPTVFHPVALAGASFSLLELSLAFASAGLLIHLLFELPSRGFGGIWQTTVGAWAVTATAVVLIILGTASLLTVADVRYRPESLRELRVVIVEPIAALVLTRWTLQFRRARLLLIGMLGAAVAVAVVAVVQVATGQGEVIGDGVGRATGLYPHPNNLALYLDRLVLFALALAVVAPRLRSVTIPITGVLAIGLAATLSRGAILAMIAGGAALIWLARIAKGWRWFAVCALVLIAPFAILAGDRLFATGTGGEVSSRELIWRASMRMIRDHPIFGVGLDQFLYQYAPRYVEPAGWPERYTSHPHNLVLDVWLRLGIAGLIVFSVGAATAARTILHSRPRPGAPARPLAIAGAAMLIGGVAHGMVDNGFFLPDLAVLTWIGLALIESRLTSESVIALEPQR